MTHRDGRSIRKTLRRLFGSKPTRRDRQRWSRRFESLEPRLMLHAHNGPHTEDPGYDLDSFHIHAQLSIYVDSERVVIPQGIGNPTSGAASIHTHDATGQIHIHPPTPISEFVTLGDVFESWRNLPATGSPSTIVLSDHQLFDRFTDNTHALQMFVNGFEVTEEFADYQVHDQDSIVLVYGENPVISVRTNMTREIPANGSVPAHSVPVAYPVELRRDLTPNTVANFLKYVNDGDFNNSIFHRYIPGFVIQGGGFESPDGTFNNSDQFTNVPTDPQIQNEFNNYIVAQGSAAIVTQGSTTITLDAAADLSQVVAGDRIRIGGRTDGLSSTGFFNITSVDAANRRVVVSQAPTSASASGLSWVIAPPVNVPLTIAMAKLGSSPNSATSQFFVNLGDNTLNLDAQNGGFTVFAEVLDPLILSDVTPLDNAAILNGILSGTQEVPSVTTAATGEVELVYSRDANTFDITATFTGIAQANVTGIHLHSGASGVEGPVIVDLLAAGAQLTQGTGGALTFTLRNVPFPTTSVNDLNNNRVYLNIHTTQNTDGEIRAQLLNGVFSDIPLDGTSPNRQVTLISSITGEGMVSGLVYSDLDRDGVHDTGEPGLQGRIVFSDADGDGTLDPTETSATTDANGAYVLRLAPGQHTIRQVLLSQTQQTAPTNPSFFTLNVGIGSNITDVRFGNFAVAAPGAVALLAATNSGSTADNITNFNNNSAARALQFSVSNVQDGATVRLFADGVLIGQATASGATVTITTNGTTSLADGARSIIATQELGGIQGAATTPLSITIDTVLPGAFTSTPPASLIIGEDLEYTPTGPGGGVTYSLTNAPTGASINATTGLVTWVPTVSQLGTRQFSIVATDVAGNARTQDVSVQVIKQPQVGASLKITASSDPNSAAISEVNVGDTFFLHAFVSDLRDVREGVFTFFQDVKFSGALAAAQTITYGTQATNSRAGTIQSGELNEIGAGKLDDNGLGIGPTHLYSVEFRASRSGALILTGDAPDTLPAHDILLLGVNTAIPFDEIAFGSAQLTINPTFGANHDLFNFDEDTPNIPLPVLSNDTTLSGTTGNLTIVDFSPVAGQTQIPGTVTIAPDSKSLIYNPPSNFNGEVTFDYSVTDGSDTLTANVIVQLHPVNDAPVAVNDTFNASANTTTNTTSNFIPVLANDTDVDGDTLKVQSVSATSGSGTVTVASGGSGVTYTPGPGFSGTETFTYVINDGKGLTSTATVTVTVSGGVNDAFEVDEESQNNSLNVLANDIGNGLLITSLGTPTRGGTVVASADGTRVIYSRPTNDNFFGIDTFTYTAMGTDGKSATATVTVTVNDTPDPPTAVADTLFVTERTTNNVLNVLANDTSAPDPLGQALTVVRVTNTTGTLGTVSVVAGQVFYTPPTTFPGTGQSTGTDTFSYTIRDPEGLEATATVTVNVVEFIPGSLSGSVFIDADNDGVRDAGEQGLANVTIRLTGTDDFGQSVARELTTTGDGTYRFDNLAPGQYKLRETQPTGQIDGLPIFDGRDTIGSQGGAASANDEFTIDLEEGIHGINNNFGELVGRMLSGSVFHDADHDSALFANSAKDARLGGLDLLIESASAGNTISRTTTTAAGTWQVTGLPAGSYRIVPETPAFLIGGATSQVVEIGAADSTGNAVMVRGRQAKYISLRDISNTAPSEYTHTAVGATGHQWYALGRGWENLADASFSLVNGSTLKVEVTTTANQTLAADINLPDPRVRVLGAEGNLGLLEIRTSQTGLNLQPVTTAAAEGESSSSMALVAAAQPISLDILPEGEGSHQHDDGHHHEELSSASAELDATLLTSTITTLADAAPLSLALPTNLPTADTSDPADRSSTQATLQAEEHAALLSQVADEFDDEFRYGASGDALLLDAVDEALDKLHEDGESPVPEALLELLALGALV